MRKIFLGFVFIGLILGLNPTSSMGWGWGSHRYINDHAVDCLPEVMEEFHAQRSYLRNHSVDPDQSDLPGFYHYIDIDYYDEFFEGTLPHSYDDLVDLYSTDIVEDNGTIPWVIIQWTDSLTHLMEQENWEEAWQIAAELGHFVADSHQPLHLTVNYNGQETGNYGIHSRYESSMINPHLDTIAPPDSTAGYWDHPLDSVFQYIGDIYPYVDPIMAADDNASSQDPDYGTTYYNLMWQSLDSLTIDALHRSVVDLAAIWYTAWVNAGNPTSSLEPEGDIPADIKLLQNYPNPFNPNTTLIYRLPRSSTVRLRIYNMAGQKVKTLVREHQTSGWRQVQWNGTDDFGRDVSTGMYLYRLEAGDFVETRKMVYMR